MIPKKWKEITIYTCRSLQAPLEFTKTINPKTTKNSAAICITVQKLVMQIAAQKLNGFEIVLMTLINEVL